MLKLQYQEAIDQKHLEINHKIDTIRKLEEALDSKDDTEMRSLRDKVKILEMLVEKRDVSIGKSEQQVKTLENTVKDLTESLENLSKVFRGDLDSVKLDILKQYDESQGTHPHLLN